MKKGLEVRLSEERLITSSGLSIVGAMLGKSELEKRSNAAPTEKRSQPYIKKRRYIANIYGNTVSGENGV